MALPRPFTPGNPCELEGAGLVYNVTFQLSNQPGPNVVGDYTVGSGKTTHSFSHRVCSPTEFQSIPQTPFIYSSN